MGKRSRDKGANWERKVAKILANIWPEARRNLSQSRSARREGGDILGTPFHVECKAEKRVDVNAAWRQAQRDAFDKPGRDGLYPLGVVLICKSDNLPPFVVLETTDRWTGGTTFRSIVSMAAWVNAWLEARLRAPDP